MVELASWVIVVVFGPAALIMLIWAGWKMLLYAAVAVGVVIVLLASVSKKETNTSLAQEKVYEAQAAHIAELTKRPSCKSRRPMKRRQLPESELMRT